MSESAVVVLSIWLVLSIVVVVVLSILSTVTLVGGQRVSQQCYPSRLTPTQWRVTHSSSLAKEKSFPENISLQLCIRNAVVDFSDKWLISQMDFPTYLELFQKPICEKD